MKQHYLEMDHYSSKNEIILKISGYNKNGHDVIMQLCFLQYYP